MTQFQIRYSIQFNLTYLTRMYEHNLHVLGGMQWTQQMGRTGHAHQLQFLDKVTNSYTTSSQSTWNTLGQDQLTSYSLLT